MVQQCYGVLGGCNGVSLPKHNFLKFSDMHIYGHFYCKYLVVLVVANVVARAFPGGCYGIFGGICYGK